MRVNSCVGSSSREKRRRDVGHFVLTDSVYEPGLRMPRHSHQRAYFCILLEGSYTESYGKISHTYSSGTVVFHPKGEIHSDQFHDVGGHTFDVAIAPQWFERLEQRSSVLTRTDHVHGGRAAWIARQLYSEFQSPDDLSHLAIEGLTLEILVEASRHARRTRQQAPPRWLSQVIDQVHERFAERLSLDQLALDAGVHPLHLARVFRRHCRCTVGDYVRKLRLEFVCSRIANSDEALAEIALAAGFSDQSHFCKSFRSHTGMTPSQYRSTSRGR